MRRIAIVFCGAVVFVSGSAVFALDRLVPAQYPTIQAAIDAAVDGDTVVAEPNTYYENINFRGKSITLTSTDPNDPAVVAGTAIDANGSGTVVTFPDIATVNCVLAGFTITGGNSSGNGGGILCRNGTITISNCIITGNSASNGGGIYNESDNLTLARCLFIGNVAGHGGGGIHNFSGSSTLADCTFSENSASTYGGGMCNFDSSARLTNCTFSGNLAACDGGGMWNYGFCLAQVTNCTFSGNSAGCDGGAIWNGHQSGATLINCTFSGNSASDYGGGIGASRAFGHTLTNCILWSNNANEGPQIALLDSYMSVSYCDIQGSQGDIYTGGGGSLNWLSGNI
ncbi:MAG: right-handed parallel beta-helix repeat-containing protein, partial [Planctomycetota bacterium]